MNHVEWNECHVEWNECHAEWNECHAEWKHYTWIYGSLAKEDLCSLKRGVGAVFHNIHTHGR